MGDIRRRLVQLFIGEVIALLALAFAFVVVFASNIGWPTEPFFFTGCSVLITGLLTMFYASVDFPPFYEFDWKSKLIKLFVIDPATNQFLYARDFSTKVPPSPASAPAEADRDKMRDELFKGAITGIEAMLATISMSSQQKLSEIDQGGSNILLEYSSAGLSPITYALVVTKDLSSLRHFEKAIKAQFESFFSGLLKNLDRVVKAGSPERVFESFDIVLNNMLT